MTFRSVGHGQRWLISTLVKLSIVHFFHRGNWIGEAPYQHGRPCSQCPPSYGGGCRNNLCYKGEQTRTVSCIHINIKHVADLKLSALLQTLSAQRPRTWMRWRSLRCRCRPAPQRDLPLNRNRSLRRNQRLSLHHPGRHLQKLPAILILVAKRNDLKQL